jgi:hypothetical protein
VDQYSPQAPSGTGGPGPELATSSSQPASKPSGGGQGGGPCPQGQIRCGTGNPQTTCFDLNNDVNNCGGCGNRCNTSAGETCQSGSCLCSNGQALNTTANCGTCGNACQGGKTCQGGNCACPSGQDTCGGSTCLDLQNDPNNCGSCGHACAQGETCQGGSCKVPCGYNSYCNSGEQCCGSGVCANPNLNQVCCSAPYYYYFRSDVCDLNLGEVCCPDVGVCVNRYPSKGQVCCTDDLYYGTNYTGYCLSGQQCCPGFGCVTGNTCP